MHAHDISAGSFSNRLKKDKQTYHTYLFASVLAELLSGNNKKKLCQKEE
jgi:hypothetical protein